MEAILALLAVFGLLSLGWLWLGKLLTPARPAESAPLYAVLRAEGDGETLEQGVERLRWLSESHRNLERVILADAGLTQEGLRLAEQLVRKHPELVLCPVEEVPRWLTGGGG
jgi:hypothetical protein